MEGTFKQGFTNLIIFGFTGDLTSRKLIPALWHLFKQGMLPQKFKIIGYSRRDLSKQDLDELIFGSLKKITKNLERNDLYGDFLNTFDYISGEFKDTEAFSKLAQIVQCSNKSSEINNNLLYIAAPPSQYSTILASLSYVGLNAPCNVSGGWSRLLLEKPFGLNLNEANELQHLLAQHFNEDQIYRIDHYLFKELVQGIENFRFSNNLFEKIWDNTTIDNIQINLHETIDVKERGNFYDGVGALRDVGQNHLLTLLALITMDYSDSESVADNRANILATLTKWRPESIVENTFFAQYDGYGATQGVKENSNTETYFALKTELAHPKWKGIPIYIDAGKKMGAIKKEIKVTLKHPDVCHLCEIAKHTPNTITFRIEPKEEIIIEFWIKKPGFLNQLEKRELSFFLYEKSTKTPYVEEYAKVIHNAMEGNKKLFINPSEIKASWEFTDPIINYWQDKNVLSKYSPENKPNVNFLPREKLTIALDTGTNKEIGLIGLGKMGKGIANQLMNKGWRVHGFNRSPDETKNMEVQGLIGAYSLDDLVKNMPSPRTIWLMVPHNVVDNVLENLLPLLEPGDVLIEGGNSYFEDTTRRFELCNKYKVEYLDVGVSGGPSGALNGACLMIGGIEKLYQKNIKLFENLSVKDGYAYFGKSGAGHFVKMVHNGIEYGMMQSLAEGFNLLKESQYNLDLGSVAKIYSNGSVIESKLTTWLMNAYSRYGNELDSEDCCSGTVAHTGEGSWTVETAKKLGTNLDIIEKSLEFRKDSVQNPSYIGKVLTALRHEFGGHSGK